MNAYHRKVKECFAKEIAQNTKPQNLEGLHRYSQQPHSYTIGQEHSAVQCLKDNKQLTTRLRQLERRVKRGSGTDIAPWLGF